jgi:hypothetical protein
VQPHQLENTMTAFSALKIGDVLYDSHRQKMGNTTMSRMTTWEVKVLEIDIVAQKALCSWNGNKPSWWYSRQIARLRRTPKK